MADRCALCCREKSSTEYCPYHSSALENLKISYKRWKDALSINWVDSLARYPRNQRRGYG